MKAIQLKRTKVLAKIEEAHNEAYDITFVKKNGEVRDMLAKQGVEHNLKGGRSMAVSPSNDNISTFDCRAVGYRTINLGTVTKLTVNGIKYKVID